MPAAKIYGPYPHRGAWRCYLKVPQGSRRWAESGPSREAALGRARDALAEFQAAADLTAGELADRYLDHLAELGRKPCSIDGARSKLALIFGESTGEPAAFTEHAARELYAALVPTRAAATHREALRAARSCYAWAVEEGLIKANPWAKVKKVGKPQRGKPQLMIDEARRLLEYCADRLHEDGALAVLFALLCGMRCSEIMSRTVREVDDGGRLIRILDSKTRAGVRPLELPDLLRSAGADRCRGRSGDAPLFPPKARQWVGRQVALYCAAAGVPDVCPHALRGQFASLAYEAAGMPHLVAAALGHVSSRTTERHYVDPGAAERTQQAARNRHLKIV